MSARAAAASDIEVARAAEALLTRGNAVDCVIAGVFAACALDASVMLGPVQILVGGGGAGLRAVDGRVRQPGKKLPRPRGFKEEEKIPDAAFVGVPSLAAALAGAHAAFGAEPIVRVMAPALALIDSKEPRASVLRRITEIGPRALATGAIAEELVAAFGRVQGGLLTLDDLEALRPSIVACATHASGAREIARAPWASDTNHAEKLDGSRVRAVAVVDHRGLVAVACYESSEDGIAVPALGLVAPRTAAPVRRGVSRATPESARAAACPLALASAGGICDIALAVTATSDAEEKLAALVADDLDARLLSEEPLAPGARVIGVARSKVGARAVRAA